MTSMVKLDVASDESLLYYIQTERPEDVAFLFAEALATRERVYGRSVYFRGLIELSNYCKNDCYYCGIRRSNRHVSRYRLTQEEILQCCREGDSVGYKTFVLQGGEDPWFTDDWLVDCVRRIRAEFPSHAITLSLGERSETSYQNLFDAGANRYLLRHETANEAHYNQLHPTSMSLTHRKECLYTLKKIGFQVGAGLMVGSPYQTSQILLEDLRFLQELEPHMVGIGPFIPHKETPFGAHPMGSLEQTLRLVALTRILLPKALIPATTALGTASSDGRERGFRAGANVVMPNLSPMNVRKKYSLYDNKLFTGEEAAEHQRSMEKSIRAMGFVPEMVRGDCAT